MESYQLHYNPNEQGKELKHLIRIDFQFERYKASIILVLFGSVLGGEVLSGYDDLSCGVICDETIELNQKHCLFIEDDDDNVGSNKYIKGVRLIDEAGDEFNIGIEDLNEHIVGLNIIDQQLVPMEDVSWYTSDEDDDENDDED